MLEPAQTDRRLTAMKRMSGILTVKEEAARRTDLVELSVFRGFEVDSAAKEPDGLDSAFSGTVELMRVHIMPPGMDGVESGNRIRSEDPE